MLGKIICTLITTSIAAVTEIRMIADQTAGNKETPIIVNSAALVGLAYSGYIIGDQIDRKL